MIGQEAASDSYPYANTPQFYFHYQTLDDLNYSINMDYELSKQGTQPIPYNIWIIHQITN